ncbi:TIGR01777 family protein [Endozoicomonas sp. SM1973]|uniref:TIGR01777 family protein n=1 Tax=Spartinivicinus marinus TaxID=2994442 RepID=A0A853IEW8_9GAMM|nr:TIGR01777 family oxidoreductase [Spartinivicinus marinus]MCX4025013.1 TIGR01777 family oxidoreductase [Spartinivicinus marinus]NYZ67705.1 TIGR01777 family protein [Spartinivicinus marinus]
MKLLMTGGTGFIGQALVKRWLKSNHQLTVLTRRPGQWTDYWNNQVVCISQFDQLEQAADFDVVINLAGEPIVDKRWTGERKRQLRASRIDLTEHLINFLKQLATPPKALLNASAIGFYGYHRADKSIDENCPAADDFAATLCKDWEQTAKTAEPLGIRVCLMRFGVVLGQGGGALQKMLLPFRLGLGGRISTGEQTMSWVYLEDLLNAIDFLINHDELSGPFNITSPNPVSNAQFSKALADQLKRPAIFPVPAFMLKLMLSEAADLLLKGQRVVPDRLVKAGFEFQFAELQATLAAILPR